MKFDELNQLKRFFATMEISEDEQKKRVDFAELLYDALCYVFTVMRIEKDLEELFNNGVTMENAAAVLEGYKETLQNRIYDIFEHMDIPYEGDYIDRLVDDILEVTARHPDDKYYTSNERALVIAQNEANTSYNYADYITAVNSGKRYKVWHTEGDQRVRPFHDEVDGMRVPINEYFIVDDEMLRFPHDFLNGSGKNLVNCRCICTYE